MGKGDSYALSVSDCQAGMLLTLPVLVVAFSLLMETIMLDAEAIAARIDNLRKSGRPVPLILEQRLVVAKGGKGNGLPKYARCGFKSDAERNSMKTKERFR